MKIYAYRVVSRADLVLLQNIISEMLKDGWQPLGSIVIGEVQKALGKHDIYYQTMVKYE